MGPRCDFPLCQAPDAPWAYLGVCLEDQDDYMSLPPEALQRLLCLYLVAQFPDDALNETVEELLELFDFYQTPPKPQRSLPVPARVSATKGNVFTRPVFPVSEEGP